MTVWKACSPQTQLALGVPHPVCIERDTSGGFYLAAHYFQWESPAIHNRISH